MQTKTFCRTDMNASPKFCKYTCRAWLNWWIYVRSIRKLGRWSFMEYSMTLPWVMSRGTNGAARQYIRQGASCLNLIIAIIIFWYIWKTTWQENRAVVCHDDVIKWKHFPRNWPCVRGIHWSPVNSPHKGQWRGALMFSLICAWINDWVNNREAGDLRRDRAHYDVIVMPWNTRWFGGSIAFQSHCDAKMRLMLLNLYKH